MIKFNENSYDELGHKTYPTLDIDITERESEISTYDIVSRDFNTALNFIKYIDNDKVEEFMKSFAVEYTVLACRHSTAKRKLCSEKVNNNCFIDSLIHACNVSSMWNLENIFNDVRSIITFKEFRAIPVKYSCKDLRIKITLRGETMWCKKYSEHGVIINKINKR